MSPPTAKTLLAALVGGTLDVAVVVALYVYGGYPALESTVAMALLGVTGFTLGFVSVFVTAHTRLLTPAVGFGAVLGATIYLELSSPLPAWSELNGHVIVEGPTHVASYANTWYVWTVLFLVAGVVEFGIRRGYGIGDRRLRKLPSLPLSPYTIAWTVGGYAGFVGVATMLLVVRSGIRPSALALVVLGFAFAVTAVPLAALLARGLLLPTVLFAIVVPYSLGLEVFVATDSPVHVLLFGPFAIVLLVAGALEAAGRSRLRGEGGRPADTWDGG